MSGAERRRAGFSLPSAIFILIILATAGVFMSKMAGVQQRTSNLALGGVRAFWAARSGLEWGINRTIAAGACQAGTFTVTEGGAGGYTVAVTCSSSQHTEESVRTVYRLTSIATRGTFGERDYTSRRVETTVTDTP